ncbi:hypothetical protein PROFUN_17136 [Planoprotostelium fungivorum]|uniref:Uncharacterized protein n=1 Tax=Planoprotostelium fungivorum TaxID=1890364 RepID=A0A2P6MMG3_9EUKA|nr:hypothetical protein PROFUN_17136 [Planoprotostelium fungivorum]
MAVHLPLSNGTPSHCTCNDYCYEYLNILSVATDIMVTLLTTSNLNVLIYCNNIRQTMKELKLVYPALGDCPTSLPSLMEVRSYLYAWDFALSEG